MVPAENQGKLTLVGYLLNLLCENIAYPGDLRKILCMRIFDPLLFLCFDGEITIVDDLVTEALELFADAGIANRGWTHIHTTSSLPQIHRNTDYVYRCHGAKIAKYRKISKGLKGKVEEKGCKYAKFSDKVRII